MALIDKSLLSPCKQDDGESRFFLLETVREFALECLEYSGEAYSIQQGHAEYYQMITMEVALNGPQQSIWLQRLERERENVQAASRWLTREKREGEEPPLQLDACLTVREIEVLRLIANGYTNAQIAEQLIISPRTVHTHVRSLYSKLEITSRSAATRYAIDHHLIE